MKSSIILTMVLLCFLSYGYPDECEEAFIVEYISDYKVPTQDLRTLVETNLSSFTLPDIKAKNQSANFTAIKCTLKYITGSKKTQHLNPVKLNVTNDSFSMTLSWDIVVQQTISQNHYTAHAEVAQIQTAYYKSYSSKENRFLIQSFNFKFLNTMIEKIFYNQTLKGKDEEKIKPIIQVDLFNSITTQLKSFAHWLDENAAKQLISVTYPENIYIYQFNGTKVFIDTKTLGLTTRDNITYIHGYHGLIVGQLSHKCPDSTPDPKAGYSLYFSDSFIKNFISVFLQTYPGYQNMRLNSKLKTGNFQWRLIDMEFVFYDFSEYQDKIMNNIYFVCQISPEFDQSYANNKFIVLTWWYCKGKIQTPEGESPQFLDAILRFKDDIQIYAQDGFLQVAQNNKQLITSQYRQTNGFIVKDKNLADNYVKNLIKYWPSRVIGDLFKVQPGNTKVSIESSKDIGTGIWVG